MFDVLRAQENPGQFFPLAAGLAAVETHGGANAARAEKPRLGLSSLRTASHLGFAVCNSTTALDLRSGWIENRVGTYRWARYYNSLTGRFLSRDPEAGKPNDPRTLHKYLYAGGDPVNMTDPNGRDFMEFLGLAADAAGKVSVALAAGGFSYCLYKEVTEINDILNNHLLIGENPARDILGCMLGLVKSVASPPFF